jgi:hypothetical protein
MPRIEKNTVSGNRAEGIEFSAPVDEDIVRLTDGSAISELELKLAVTALPPAERVELAELLDGYVKLAGCTLERSPGKSDNWIERVGGSLPEYICEVAKSIHQKRGVTLSRAISIAIGVMKNWSSGRGEVNADTRAKAAKALAQWNALKAKAKAKS